MEWAIIDSDRTKRDPTGVEGFIIRMDKELRGGGPPLEGFKFLHSGLDMLRVTRDIEAEVQAGGASSSLYVGFQTAEKLTAELKRYRRLGQQEVRVVGFGWGNVTDEADGALEQWVELPSNRSVFENQWFLVAAQPTPIVFIGWETSDPQRFAQGGISSPGKEFKGFVSGDQRVVDGVIAYLEAVRRRYGPDQGSSVQQLTDQIKFPMRRIMVLTDDRANSELESMREDAIRLAMKRSSSLVLYDISSASYLVSPYPSDEFEKQWRRALDKTELAIFQRKYLVQQLENLEDRGINAGVILPTAHGFPHLAQWAEREKADLIMIPETLVRPGLLERLKGYTLKALLDNTNIPVLVYQSKDSAWLRTSSHRAPIQESGAIAVSSKGTRP